MAPNPYEIKPTAQTSGLTLTAGQFGTPLITANATSIPTKFVAAPKPVAKPVGIISTKSIADKVIVPAQKSLAEMTKPPTIPPPAPTTPTPPPTPEKPKENPNQAIDGTIGTPIKLADALVTFNNDLTGLHQTSNGDYIPDASALERVGIKGVTTSSGIDTNQLQMAKAQKEAQDAQNQVSTLNNQMQQFMMSDEQLAGITAGISAAWDARIAEMQRINTSRTKAITTTGIRTGSQYTGGAGGVFGGIISEEERQGVARVGELEAQKQSAIAAAKQAQQTQNWTVFSKMVTSAENLAKQKLDAVTELQKAQAAQDVKLREEEKTLNDQNSVSDAFDMLNTPDATALEVQALLREQGKNVDLEKIDTYLKIINPEKKVVDQLAGLSADFRTFKFLQDSKDPVVKGLTYPDYIRMIGNAKRVATKEPSGKTMSNRTAQVLDGFTKIDELTPTEQAKVRDDLFSLGYGSSKVPDWFRQIQQEERQQSLLPSFLQELWETERARFSGGISGGNTTDTKGGGADENSLRQRAEAGGFDFDAMKAQFSLGEIEEALTSEGF